jgi:hypothetical protein
MTDEQFGVCARVLGRGDRYAPRSESWCGWTTFDSLLDSMHYWSAGLPAEEDLDQAYIKDNGVWGQPFSYQQLAHIVIPREFFREIIGSEYTNGTKVQDIARLSRELTHANIAHRLTDLVLEIKLY